MISLIGAIGITGRVGLLVPDPDSDSDSGSGGLGSSQWIIGQQSREPLACFCNLM